MLFEDLMLRNSGGLALESFRFWNLRLLGDFLKKTLCTLCFEKFRRINQENPNEIFENW